MPRPTQGGQEAATTTNNLVFGDEVQAPSQKESGEWATSSTATPVGGRALNAERVRQILEKAGGKWWGRSSMSEALWQGL